MSKYSHNEMFSPEGSNCMIATPHYFASQAGAEILKCGGSAIDSILAANAVLCVVYPHMCGLGGDLFAQVWDPSSKQTIGLNASGRSGERATSDLFLSDGVKDIYPRGPLSALTVPGVVDGWWKLHQRYGKLSWETIFQPAIEFARGFPISKNLSDSISENLSFLKLSSDGFRTFTNDGKPLNEGDFLVQGDLRDSLVLLSKDGPDVFYKGRLSDLIIGGLENIGGVLTKEDFSRHSSLWVDPIHTYYRNYKVTQLPPNSQGIIFLMMLNILENWDWSNIARLSPQYYHILVESFKKVIPDLEQWITDPETLSIPIDHLLSKQYGKEKFLRIDSMIVSNNSFISNKPTNGDTVYLCAVDSDGMAVSLMQSIFREFGSGIMPAQTGILLQNRGASFSLSPTHPNRLFPRKRPSHTLMPAMVFKEDRPFLVFGTMGGEGQAQTLATVLTNLLDFNMQPQEAIDSPRWFYGCLPGDTERILYLESRVPKNVPSELLRLGNQTKLTSDFSKYMGHAQAIMINPATGRLSGAADLRADGLACGL